jgi:hypothetical protein
MSNFKEASKLGLKFNTAKGMLSIDQLWSLGVNDLSNAIKAVKKELKKNDDDELSFLEVGNTVDTENQLRFDILKEVYMEWKKDSEERRNAAANKANRQKIVDLIEMKKEESLAKLSVEELEAMLNK